MPDDYVLSFHPEFFADMKKLDNKEKTIVQRQIRKIKQNPTRFKHLHGRENCYRIRTGNLRIVYYLDGNKVWFLTVEKRDTVYSIYFRRLHNLKQKME